MYRGEYLGCAETEPHAEYGRGVRFRWRILAGDHAGEEATCICGVEKPPTPKNRLGRILGGLAGKAIEAGERIAPDAYIGRQYLLQVEAAPSGTGTRVATVMPSF